MRRLIALVVVLIVPTAYAAEIRITIPDSELKQAVEECCQIMPCPTTEEPTRSREALESLLSWVVETRSWGHRHSGELHTDIEVLYDQSTP